MKQRPCEAPQAPEHFSFLTARSDYLALRQGDRMSTPGFLLVRRRRGENSGGPRVGITVTRKIGNAVKRNRIRRRLKEGARVIFPLHAEAGCDYVMIARHAAEERPFSDLLDDMKRALLSLPR